MNTLFTVGYASWSIEEIEALLHKRQAILIDIRSSPRSNKPGFDGRTLADRFGDRYRHMPALGIVNHRNPDLPVILRDEELGLKGLTRFLEETNVIIICGCRDLEKCHRFTVAEKFKQALGIAARHL